MPPNSEIVGARAHAPGVLDCGEGAARSHRFRRGWKGQEVRFCSSDCGIQSGDCADSVTAFQNLAAVRALDAEETRHMNSEKVLGHENFC